MPLHQLTNGTINYYPLSLPYLPFDEQHNLHHPSSPPTAIIITTLIKDYMGKASGRDWKRKMREEAVERMNEGRKEKRREAASKAKVVEEKEEGGEKKIEEGG